MARFKTGERVRFLHEKQEGVVQKVISPERIEVLVDDFIELIVSPSELVPIDRAEEKLSGLIEKPEEKLRPEVMDAMHPELNIIKTPDSEYEFWLVNPPAGQILFALYLKQKHKYAATRSGILESDRNVMMAVLESNAFHELQGAIIQFLRFREGEKGLPPAPFTVELKPRQEVINMQPEMLPVLKKMGYAFILTHQAIVEETSPEALPVMDMSKRKSMEPAGPVIVDLHIEKLVKSTFGMSSAAMLQLQLEHFEKRLTDGLMDGIPEMVFIHGIGDGVLRKEMEKKLSTFNFIKGSRLGEPRLYGNGATVVELDV